MDGLMVERETALLGRIAPLEIQRHDNPSTDQAKGDRPVDLRAFDQLQPPMVAEGARGPVQPAKEAAVGEILPEKENGRAAGPDREQQGHPLPGSAVRRQRRGLFRRHDQGQRRKRR
jgi:hypothetical protein